MPNPNPALPQKQVINVEVASVPARDVDVLGVQANYDHLPLGLRNMILRAESATEILADKIVALGARKFLKSRDVWDIKFLTDRGLQIRYDLIRAKLQDYQLDADTFSDSLRARAEQLQSPAAADAFRKEMLRFVDPHQAEMLAGTSGAVGGFLQRSAEAARMAAKEISPGARPAIAAAETETPRPG